MILLELEEILGQERLRDFLALFAATSVVFPKVPRGPFFDHLVRLVGQKHAEQLQERFAGEQVYIPRNAAEERARRNAEIRARLASGESPRAIARSYRTVTTLSVRTVERIRTGISKLQTHKSTDPA